MLLYIFKVKFRSMIHQKVIQLFLVLLFFNGFAFGQTDNFSVKENYNKQEVQITMRDGIKLHTSIYMPKDTSRKYPILLQRTPYSCRPYGEENFPRKIGPNKKMMQAGYIVVYQDVRGRWMSEGSYDNMRPFIPKKKKNQIDEASDAYDTIEWLVNNVPNNNGRVGTWGISYPGFYATYSLLANHPALKAVSPQACIGDFFFDDFHHNGAYMLSYWMATALFGEQHDGPTQKAWYNFPKPDTPDAYQFYLDHTPLSKLDPYYKDNFFWQQLKEHPNYDSFWQKRGIIQHLKSQKIKPAVMTVGGLFDAEDLYGPFNTYKTIEAHQKNKNTLVFGPWSHGGWASTKKRQAVGEVFFGENISQFFQEEVETQFFEQHLKTDNKKRNSLPEALVYDTGLKKWDSLSAWPPKQTKKMQFYLADKNQLSTNPKAENKHKFISDPLKPVPYSEDLNFRFTPRPYMTGDQRFAAKRPDVLVFETDVLQEELKLSGEIMAKLKVATTGSAADWVVKIIDVHPPKAKNHKENNKARPMGNYHMMVRSEVLRGRFRNSFAKPEPFVPHKKTDVNFVIQDINHTFKPGQKLQIQVQSTWFPLIDINPQNYVENIFKAKESDFEAQEHTVFGDSYIEFDYIPQTNKAE